MFRVDSRTTVPRKDVRFHVPLHANTWSVGKLGVLVFHDRASAGVVKISWVNGSLQTIPLLVTNSATRRKQSGRLCPENSFEVRVRCGVESKTRRKVVLAFCLCSAAAHDGVRRGKHNLPLRGSVLVYVPLNFSLQNKKRSLAGNVGIGFFVVAFVTIAVAFSTPSWLVSDYRITGAKLDRFGLWTHCYRSLQDPTNPNRFFVGCRWIYDPFTTGWDRIRGFLVPGFMVATQLFFTLCFISALVSAILTLLYFLCCGPDMKQFVLLIKLNAWILLFGGVCGAIAVIVFASTANRNGWMPGHDNNFFGWSFILGCIGVVAMLVASTLFFTDSYVQQRKRDKLRDSQSRFEMERETRA